MDGLSGATVLVNHEDLVALQCAAGGGDGDISGGCAVGNYRFDEGGMDLGDSAGTPLKETMLSSEALPEDHDVGADPTVNCKESYERRQARIKAEEHATTGGPALGCLHIAFRWCAESV